LNVSSWHSTVRLSAVLILSTPIRLFVSQLTLWFLFANPVPEEKR
jgi:hypothetical protein